MGNYYGKSNGMLMYLDHIWDSPSNLGFTIKYRDNIGIIWDNPSIKWMTG